MHLLWLSTQLLPQIASKITFPEQYKDKMLLSLSKTQLSLWPCKVQSLTHSGYIYVAD